MKQTNVLWIKDNVKFINYTMLIIHKNYGIKNHDKK